MQVKKSMYYYEKLLNMNLYGVVYIDPLHDLGTFNSFHMKFEESIEELINPWNNKPYLPELYPLIQKMRKVYILWQKALLQETKESQTDQNKTLVRSYVRTAKIRAEQERLIKSYIQCGFRTNTISQVTEYAQKTIRNNFSYFRHVHQRAIELTILKTIQGYYKKIQNKEYIDSEMDLNKIKKKVGINA